jgi:antitoxin component YwqK of YwqJK toxin-antitoxin module
MMKKRIHLLVIFQFILFTILSCSDSQPKSHLIREHYKNGKISKEYYVDESNQKNGTYKEYYENGKTKYLHTYLNNQLDGPQSEYYESGELKSTAIFKNSKPDSIVKWYYPNGILQSESFWLAGRLFGVQKEFLENGELKDLYFMANDSDQLFSFDINSEGKAILQGNRFTYCIYEKDMINIDDSAKVVFYALVPPNYTSNVNIVEKKNAGYRENQSVTLENINNNKGVYYVKKFTEPGNYEIGIVIELKNSSLNHFLFDSVFLPIKVVK